MPLSRIRFLQAGFTLVELSIVLIISGLIIGTISSAMNIYIKKQRIEATRTRLQMAEGSLNAYLNLNYHYPCPALPSITRGKKDFGKAAESCYEPNVKNEIFRHTKTSTASEFMASVPGRNDQPVTIGLLPFRSLNMSDTNATDGWGNLFFYAVTSQLTDPFNFAQNAGAINVVAEDKQSRSTPPGSVQYVIFSTGEDGKGAVTSNGVPGLPCDTNLLEGENCNGDSVFMDAPFSMRTGREGLFYQNPAVVSYDDIVVYSQFNPKFSTGGLFVIFYGQCPTPFREFKLDNSRQASDILTLYKKPTFVMSDEDRNNSGFLSLCYTPYYSKVLFLTVDSRKLKPDPCPPEWTELGYKAEDGNINYQACAK